MQSRRACDQICFSVSSFICIISRTERHSASWLWENDQKKMVLNCFLCLLLLFLCTTNLKHRCLQGHWLFEVTCLLTDLLQDSEQMKLRHNIFCIFLWSSLKFRSEDQNHVLEVMVLRGRNFDKVHGFPLYTC